MTGKKLCPECYGWGTLPINNESCEGFCECFKCHGTGIVDDPTNNAIQREQKPMTNADRIRAMTDEELAELLEEAGDDMIAARASCWLDWLQQPCGGAE